MTDIFVSYAHEDSTAAEVLANDLLSLGWTVWRDDRIEVSDIFDDVIEARLDGASCVVVIWSPSSVRSRWVRAEAAAADEQGKLIPVCFHPDIVLPMRFRQIKAAMLPSPQLDQHEKSARAFLAEVARLTGITPASLDHLLPAQRASSRPGTNAVTVGNWALRAQNLRTRFSGGNLNLRLFPDGSAVGDLVFRSERPWKAVNARHKAGWALALRSRVWNPPLGNDGLRRHTRPDARYDGDAHLRCFVARSRYGCMYGRWR